MAQNGFTRRTTSNTSSSGNNRTYPGTAARLPGSLAGRDGGGGGGGGRVSSGNGNHNGSSEPTVFVRPLTRSHLAPVHAVGPMGEGRSTLGISTTTGAPTPPTRPISLDQPRPSSERHRNLYLGAPILTQHHSNNNSGNNISSGANNNSSLNSKNNRGGIVLLDSTVTAAEQVRLPTNSRKKAKNNINSDTTSSQGDVVTTQPTKRSLLVDCSVDVGGGGGSVGGGSGNGKGVVAVNNSSNNLAESSIVCPYCRKCRCEACATPRPLPSRWICSKSIHCGPEPLLDYLTCLCCVKAVFYHCGKNHEPDGGVMLADKPCSCAPHRKFWRWGCMTAMSLILPCLCLYWPCKACIHLAEKSYQRYHNNGCTCRPPGCGNSSLRDGAADTSEEDEQDRASSHFSHHHHHLPPVQTARNNKIGTNKLLPSD